MVQCKPIQTQKTSNGFKNERNTIILIVSNREPFVFSECLFEFLPEYVTTKLTEYNQVWFMKIDYLFLISKRYPMYATVAQVCVRHNAEHYMNLNYRIYYDQQCSWCWLPESLHEGYSLHICVVLVRMLEAIILLFCWLRSGTLNGTVYLLVPPQLNITADNCNTQTRQFIHNCRPGKCEIGHIHGRCS